MAISYASSGFTFVDSQFGSASAANIKSLVNVAIDRRYHKEVQAKLFWTRNGLIGPDTYSEGTGVSTAPGYPIIRKTDLTKNPGDTIIMGLRKNLAFTVNTGKVHDTQLVDAEVAFDFNNMKVKIDLWRQGVRTNAGMNRQRNPYESLEAIETSLLSDWSAQMYDTSIFYGLHYGYAPHTFREYGEASAVPAAMANTIFGNDETLSTSSTIAALTGAGADDLSAKTLELGALFMEQNNFDPVMVNGEPWWVCVVSPRGRYYLLKDDRLRNAFKDAPNVAAVRAALRIMKREPERIGRLWEVTARMREGLRAIGYDIGLSETPIFPVRVGDSLTAFKMCKELQNEGVFVNPVVAPAVPEGECILRVSLMATHTPEQVDVALGKMEQVGRALHVV